MSIKQILDDSAKLFAVLSDACKFLVLAALTTFAIAAIANPVWARKKLSDLGLSVKEINAFGVKLAADDGFDMAKALADAKLSLESAKTQLAQLPSKGNGEPLSKAIAELDKVQMSLVKQSTTLKDVQEKAGVIIPTVPDTAWLFVGRVTEEKIFQPAPEINAAETKINGDKVIRIQIKSLTKVVANGDECVRKRVEDIQQPTNDELQRMTILISPANSRPLEVIKTISCPSIGNATMLWSEIRIRKEDATFVKYETLLRR